MFISVTRLKLRSIRSVPAFALEAFRTRGQAMKAPGFVAGSVLADRRWTFWTLTGWDSEADMRRYMLSGPHRTAMPRLAEWCDEASVVHWEQADAALPGWLEADQRMRRSGRPSPLRHPSPLHASLAFAAPRTKGSVSMVPPSARVSSFEI